jgi:hypothetical protein
MGDATLLARRKRYLATEIANVLEEAGRLRIAHESGVYDPHGMTTITTGLLHHAQLAASYARLVEDLDDVQRYGPGGGR